MKILLVSNTDWYLFRFRLALAAHLRSQNMQVVFVSPAGKHVQSIEAHGFQCVNWPLGRKSTHPVTELAAVYSLAKIFRQQKPDLVHLHTIKPVLYGSLAAWLLGIKPVVRSVTGLGYVFLAENRHARLLRSLLKIVYRFIFRVGHGMTIFENQTDRNYFLQEKFVREEQSVLIEGVGVDTDFYQPQPEPQGIATVALAARFLWDKGVGEYVEAARLVRQRGIEARFLLVGQTDPGNPASIPDQTIETWSRQGLVECWGWQSDMRAVFSAAHIVTLPSYREGLPTVLIEAAACARPLVATDVPGCRDVVQHGVNGCLVPPRDARQLSEALIHLLESAALRQQMGAASRQMAEQRFDIAHVNRQTLNVYQRLLALPARHEK